MENKLEIALEKTRESFERRLKIRHSKCADYASLDNPWLNFQQRAKLIEILKPDLTNPSQVALFDGVLKIQRIINLVNQGKKAENESLEDSYDDLQNYIDLSREQL